MDQYTEEQKAELQSCCPTGVFDINENTGAVIIANPTECIFCKECVFLLEDFRKNPEDKLGVEIKHSTNKYTFTIETTGALTAKEVVKDAFVQLTDKIVKLQKEIPRLTQKNY